METEQEFDDAKKFVEDVLSTDQRARNDDLWLILQVWQKKQLIKCFVPYDQINLMVKPETITRVRREIQNTECRLLPTDPQVVIRRKMKEEEVRKHYTPEFVKEYERIRYGVK